MPSELLWDSIKKVKSCYLGCY